jgi:histidinol dehydrogenase
MRPLTMPPSRRRPPPSSPTSAGRGDAAVLEYTRRFDAIDAPSVADLEIGAGELAAARDGLSQAQRSALEAAAARVRDFHQRQLEATGRAGATATPMARCSARR